MVHGVPHRPAIQDDANVLVSPLALLVVLLERGELGGKKRKSRRKKRNRREANEEQKRKRRTKRRKRKKRRKNRRKTKRKTEQRKKKQQRKGEKMCIFIRGESPELNQDLNGRHAMTTVMHDERPSCHDDAAVMP